VLSQTAKIPHLASIPATEERPYGQNNIIGGIDVGLRVAEIPATVGPIHRERWADCIPSMLTGE